MDCQQDGDPVTIERAHGEWRDSERFQGKIEISAGPAAVKVEYRCALGVSEVELEQVKQALESASTHLFGEPSGAKVLPAQGTHLAG
jgi:hypothetical protein